MGKGEGGGNEGRRCIEVCGASTNSAPEPPRAAWFAADLASRYRGHRRPPAARCRPRRGSCRPAPDQFERNLAGIGKPMNAPNGDIDQLVFVHVADVIAGRDLSRPLHDDPMLRPVEVLLQRERAAGLHDNALHTITGGNVDVLVVAPGRYMRRCSVAAR